MLTVHKSTGRRNSLVTLELNLKKYLELIFYAKFSFKFPYNSRNEERERVPARSATFAAKLNQNVSQVVMRFSRNEIFFFQVAL